MASRRGRIDEQLESQARALDALENTELRRFLRAYEDGRRELLERLTHVTRAIGTGVTTATQQHLRIMLAQTESGILVLQNRLSNQLALSTALMHDLALVNLLRLIRAAEPGFRDTGGQIETAALRVLTERQGLLLHRHSIRRYGNELIELIQREIVAGVTTGSTIRQITNRIAATDDSVFAGNRHRANLIARMEINRSYNDGHQVALEETAEITDLPGDSDPMLKRADEFLDKRNHPMSRALNGRLAPVKGAWEVPVSEVAAWAKVLGKGASGIVWTREGSNYVGSNYPAHFNDRGRQTPWRASWGASAPAKPPKGSQK